MSANLKSRNACRSTSIPGSWYPVILASLLYVMLPRRSRGEEDRVDFKVMYYEEADDRIQVFSPTFLYERMLSPTLTLRIDGIYNVISGASPTGAPPVPTTIIRSAALLDAADFTVLSGATSQPSASGGGGGSGGGSSSTVRTRAIGPVTKSTDLRIQTAEVEDTRIGGNIELSKRRDRDTLTGQVSASTEDDYMSLALALKDAMDFNNRNTTLLTGVAFTHDWIDNFSSGAQESRDSFDLLIGVTQLLTPVSLVSANFTLGFASGYMDDPYKVAQVNDRLVPEKRPDTKTKQILYLAWLRHFATVNGTSEVGYRFYHDSFGILGHTLSLAWMQRVGEHLIVKPSLRFYDQTEADFYATSFAGNPEEYSADYRISALNSYSYGIKLIYQVTDRLSLDAAYEYYEQEGKDDATLSETYPSANILTAGLSLWF